MQLPGFGLRAPYCGLRVLNTQSACSRYQSTYGRAPGDMATSAAVVLACRISMKGKPSIARLLLQLRQRRGRLAAWSLSRAKGGGSKTRSEWRMYTQHTEHTSTITAMQILLRHPRPARGSDEKKKKKACQNSIDTHPARAPEGKTSKKSG